MIALVPLLASFLAAATPAPAPEPDADAWAWAGVAMAQASITIRQRVIVRVPVPAPAKAAEAPITRWRERRGPRCIPLDDIAGAQITARDSVDLILRGGMRLRAELEDECPALDFYGGFYLRPGPNRQICADRDEVHTRSGGQCVIERFKLMVPVRAR
ncbi:hypothetical protein [Sphingomonas quercus]|uniref:DUF3617 family protein n=1 Tax=Sphingomonas quercus TaxID=2842451 RepID=A0ABS6BPY2_9SPHN|nr:hypothetical protein [Sphingomonas quercus]MBU3079270.1 hypothetical protein [Sphingomonas quercus]